LLGVGAGDQALVQPAAEETADQLTSERPGPPGGGQDGVHVVWCEFLCQLEPVGRDALLGEECDPLIGRVLAADDLCDLLEDQIAELVAVVFAGGGGGALDHPAPSPVLALLCQRQVLNWLQVVVRILQACPLIRQPPGEVTGGLGDEQLLEEARHQLRVRGIRPRDLIQQLLGADPQRAALCLLLALVDRPEDLDVLDHGASFADGR
jgi:hypothetical protein